MTPSAKLVFVPYETILTLPIASFIWNISLVVLADGVGLLWVLGKINKLPKKLMVYAHRLIWLGLAVSVSTGAFMFWELRDYLLSTPAFYTKIIFVLTLMINALFISKHLKTALIVGAFNDLSSKEKGKFLLSGFVSAISWVTVFLSAKMLGL